jgi:hypothetical protein
MFVHHCFGQDPQQCLADAYKLANPDLLTAALSVVAEPTKETNHGLHVVLPAVVSSAGE